MKKYILLAFLTFFSAVSFAQDAATADAILTPVLSQAKKEKKNVIVIFHASWCGWCKKMDKSLADSTVKKYFDDNYVITHLTVQESDDKKKLENPGAEDLMQSYRKGMHGLPYFAILSADNKLLTDSYGAKGNVGCPASEEEVKEFIKMISTTSKIDKDGLKAIELRFRKNEVSR